MMKFLTIILLILFSCKKEDLNFKLQQRVNSVDNSIQLIADKYCIDKFDSSSFTDYLNLYYQPYQLKKIEFSGNLCLISLVKKDSVVFYGLKPKGEYSVVR